MYNTFPFLVHSSTPREITFTVPGHVEEEATLPTSKIGYEIREYIRRRCKYGDFPIAFAVRIKGNPSKPEDFIPDHYNSWTIPPPPPFQELDFRAITRNPERARTTITVDMGYIYGQVKWITAGQVDLSGPDDRGVSTLKAYLPAGVTDFEHDSSYAFYFDLIGLRFKHTWYGTSWFEGFLHSCTRTSRTSRSRTATTTRWSRTKRGCATTATSLTRCCPMGSSPRKPRRMARSCSRCCASSRSPSASAPRPPRVTGRTEGQELKSSGYKVP